MKKFLFILIFCINLFGEERIVTLSPSINEIVFALEKGQNVVANTMFCDYPMESKSIPKIFIAIIAGIFCGFILNIGHFF